MARALIADFEMLSPFGESHEEFAEKLFSGQSGISSLQRQYGHDFPVRAVGLIPQLQGKREPNFVAKNLLVKLLARHAGKKIDGVVFFVPQEDELAAPHAPMTCDQQISFFRESVQCDRWIGIHEACVSGLSGLNMAAQRIRTGIWRRALVVGVDLRCSPLDLLRLHSLGALTTRDANSASSPFSRERDGFVRAQGAAVFLLEQNSEKAWGEISGFGQTCDAWRLTEARPDCTGAIQALKQALRMSGLELSEIDAVSAHATSTPIGDALEARALQILWGEAAPRLAVTALKSQLGHAGQASGLLQVAAALFMLREQCLSPIVNFSSADPEVNLDFISGAARPARLRHILCNATAFGGQNACLILSGSEAMRV